MSYQNGKRKSKAELLRSIDPNGVGQLGRLFGLPFEPEHAEVVLIPVPWEVTVSYGTGTAEAPEAVLYASSQLDLFEPDIPDAWTMGIAMLDIPEHLSSMNENLREEVEDYLQWLESGQPDDWDGAPYMRELPYIVDQECEKMNNWVYETACEWLDEDKIVAVLGGDHSTPYGLIKALCERYENLGILQIDAHADLREAYEGFRYSHASIMYNVLQFAEVKKLVQVGVRDFCEAEMQLIRNNPDRIHVFFDQAIKEERFAGKTWQQYCQQIIDSLPEYVYISFDIDGLDPKLCPLTGTPVPGGLDFAEAVYLIKQLVQSGRKIVGFDLVEVGSSIESDWDANVGARILYKLCNWAGRSLQRI